MSPIEKLKTEAAALREQEAAAGRPLKHCEALERVAKSHGYASWRACAAMLGAAPDEADPPPTPPAIPPASAGEVRPSRLLEGEFSLARERAFTRWMTPDLLQAAADFSRNIGLAPIYAETSAQGTRYLFWHPPAGILCEVRSNRPKEVFLDFDRKNRAQGRKLITLSIGADQRYSAVWISEAHYPAAAEFLGRLGIGPAEAAPAG